MERIRRRRSKTGCQSCRRRKVRCDEGRPVCQACARLRLACSYPADRNGHREFPASTAVPGNVERDPHNQGAGSLPCSPSYTGPWDAALGSGRSLRPDDSTLALLPSPRIRTASRLQVDPAHRSQSDDTGEITPTDLSPVLYSQPGRSTRIGRSADNVVNDLPILSCSNERPRSKSNGGPAKPVTIRGEDREPLQHFLTTMVHFCVLRNSLYNNLYSHILTTIGFDNESLFTAMMAWSALHLAHIHDTTPSGAQERASRAIELLQEALSEGQNLDTSLATVWFLMQYELLLAEGVDKYCDHLGAVVDHLERRLEALGGNANEHIGPIGSIILVWMSARDVQAAYFGGGGRLLRLLKMTPHIYDLVDKAVLFEDMPSKLSWSSPPKSQESIRLQDSLRLSLRNQIVMGQIIILSYWPPVESDHSSWRSVLASLQTLRKEMEEENITAATEALAVATGSPGALPVMSALAYNRMLLLANYYGSVISYLRHISECKAGCRNENSLDVTANECAARIIRITQRVVRDQPNSPRAFWPHLLFLAAVTIDDPVYQSWAVRTFERASIWGKNLVKARDLLELVIERQNSSLAAVDFIKVMAETTGYFIL